MSLLVDAFRPEKMAVDDEAQHGKKAKKRNYKHSVCFFDKSSSAHGDAANFGLISVVSLETPPSATNNLTDTSSMSCSIGD